MDASPSSFLPLIPIYPHNNWIRVGHTSSSPFRHHTMFKSIVVMLKIHGVFNIIVYHLSHKSDRLTFQKNEKISAAWLPLCQDVTHYTVFWASNHTLMDLIICLPKGIYEHELTGVKIPPGANQLTVKTSNAAGMMEVRVQLKPPTNTKPIKTVEQLKESSGSNKNLQE